MLRDSCLEGHTEGIYWYVQEGNVLEGYREFICNVQEKYLVWEYMCKKKDDLKEFMEM